MFSDKRSRTKVGIPLFLFQSKFGVIPLHCRQNVEYGRVSRSKVVERTS